MSSYKPIYEVVFFINELNYIAFSERPTDKEIYLNLIFSPLLFILSL